ncbi:MAG: flavocytochrome c [Acidobacteriota bacterium]|nr:flavocytochrome c [Acidobacteriota bacterium]
MKFARLAILSLFAGLFGMGAYAQPAPERVVNTDIVVIGAGGAGFNAAVTAAQAKAKVIMLEKMPTIGGATIISGGSMNFPDPKLQEPKGIKDSPDIMYRQTLDAGDNRGDPALVRVLADNAPELKQWYESLGLVWADRVFEPFGGLFPRGHNSGATTAGRDYVRVLNDEAKKLGVEIRTNTRAVSLIRDGANGSVYGVKAEDKEGKITFLAKAVVIATGGFSGNVEMRMKYDPRLDKSFHTTANPSGKAVDFNTGDGILMGEHVGAELVGMDYIQLIPWYGGRAIDYVGGDVWVNSEGKRFVNEGGRRDKIADAILAAKGQFCWVITDDQSIKNSTVESKLKTGLIKKANTIEEMAKGMDMDAKVLRATLERYNKFAALKQDPDFGKTTFTQLINKPPYYYGMERENVHFTEGGLHITPRTEVLDVDGKIIPGLYAAGEVTGGVHGDNRAGGNSLAAISVFGRIAGKNAAALVAAGSDE